MADAADTVLRKFKEALEQQWTQRPKCTVHHNRPCNCLPHPKFHNTPSIHKWMLEKDGEDSLTNIEHLLNLQEFITPLFMETEEWDPKCILDEGQECVLVFSLLLSADYGKWLYYFHSAGYNDKNLSDLDHSEKKNRLKGVLREQGDLNTTNAEIPEPQIAAIVRKFDEERWLFCPVQIDGTLRVTRQCEDMRIMPFCARDEQSLEGGTAVIYTVLVPEEFVSDEYKTILGRPHDYGDNREYRDCYNFAIKSYPEEHLTTFQSELTAYRGLRKRPGVIKCFGSYQATTYSATTKHANKTYNLILQIGSTDLYEYYKMNAPPLEAHAIIDSWDLFCDVAGVIQYMHHFSNQYHGWHGDIKPKNILLVDGRLKLFDFGFAEFTKRINSNLDLPSVNPRGRTETYGPPEKKNINKMFDIWSFGCVLSVHATWVTAGFSGVIDFSTFRSNANKKKDKTSQSDAFHDGKEVLEEIKEWHDKYLREVMRKSDVITSEILDFVESDMLLTDPGSRLDAQEVCKKLHAIVKKWKNEAPRLHLSVREARIETERRRERVEENEVKGLPPQRKQITEADYLLSATRFDTRLSSGHSSRIRGFQSPLPSRGESLNQTLKPTNGGDMKYDLAKHSPGKSGTHWSGHSDQQEPSESEQVIFRSVSPAGSLRNAVSGTWAKEKRKENEEPPKPPDQPAEAHPSSSKVSTRTQISNSANSGRPNRDPSDVAIAAAYREPDHNVPGIIVDSPTAAGPQCDRVTSPRSIRPAAELNVNVAESSRSKSTTQQESPVSVSGPTQTTPVPVVQQSEIDEWGCTEEMRLASDPRPLNLVTLRQKLVDARSISARDKDGKTVLHHLVTALATKTADEPNRFLQILTVIQSKDETIIDQPDFDKCTALYYATEKPYLADALIRAGAQVNKMCFDLALEMECSELIEHYLRTVERAELVQWIKGRERSKQLLHQRDKLVGKSDNQSSWFDRIRSHKK